MDVSLRHVLLERTERILEAGHGVDVFVSINDEQGSKLAVLNRIGHPKGAESTLDKARSSSAVQKRVDHTFEATRNGGPHEFPPRAEVMVDIASIDPCAVGHLAKIESGENPIAPNEVQCRFDEPTLGLSPILLGLCAEPCHH